MSNHELTALIIKGLFFVFGVILPMCGQAVLFSGLKAIEKGPYGFFSDNRDIAIQTRVVFWRLNPIVGVPAWAIGTVFATVAWAWSKAGRDDFTWPAGRDRCTSGWHVIAVMTTVIIGYGMFF